MKNGFRVLYVILIGLLIVACSSIEATPPIVENNQAGVEVETEKEPTADIELTIPMSDFFPSDNVTTHFKGEGNEFAELKVEIIHIDNQYVVQRENNGGAYVQTIYKVNENNIEIIKDKDIDFEEALPNSAELNALSSLGIYLQQPFEEGAAFGQWTIIDIDAVVETPYKTFDNVIIIEMNEEDFINRKYFVRNIGEVKRESIMSIEGEEDFIVTSTLQSITD